MTLRKLRLTEIALDSLDEIRDYVASRSKSWTVAEQTIDTILDAAGELCETPGVGHSRSDLTSQPFLFTSVFGYLIIYEVEDDFIDVHLVVHGARDVERILEEVFGQ